MTHPSDETFLDEMAAMDSQDGSIFVRLTLAEKARLVALARRAPALTLTTPDVITETYGPCWQCAGNGWVHVPYVTAPQATCSRCSGTGQIVVSRTLHAPAPPEARP